MLHETNDHDPQSRQIEDLNNYHFH